MNKIFIYIITAGIATNLFGQGSLIPAGPPAETMKTLNQIEPRIDIATVAGNTASQYIITNSGSFYLSSDIISPRSTAINIRAKNVTIDLNGFTISPGFILKSAGISISSGMNGATIRNGNITGFDYGVRFFYSPTFASGTLLEHLSISNCKDYGIYAGEASQIINCQVNNSGKGIYSREGSIISDCVSHDNAGNGIDAQKASLISRCLSFNNVGYGIHTLNGGNISDCNTYNNSNYGTRTESGSLIYNCSSSTNSGRYGFYASRGAIISKCLASYNICKYGIAVSYNSIIDECKSTYNTSTNSESGGIFANAGSTIFNSTSTENLSTYLPASAAQGCGIRTGSAAVNECETFNNKGDGIRVSSSCFITDNKCQGNGKSGYGAGIHSTSYNNQIINNFAKYNKYGIAVDSSGNLIVNNFTQQNSTNYSISAGNNVGTIKVNFLSADAWDNFSTL